MGGIGTINLTGSVPPGSIAASGELLREACLKRPVSRGMRTAEIGIRAKAAARAETARLNQ